MKGTTYTPRDYSEQESIDWASRDTIEADPSEWGDEMVAGQRDWASYLLETGRAYQ